MLVPYFDCDTFRVHDNEDVRDDIVIVDSVTFVFDF